MTLPLAITCGDPAGIGPPVIQQWLASSPQWRERVVVLGPKSFLKGLDVEGIPLDTEAPLEIEPGRPNVNGARCAWKAMEWAATGCREGRFAGVVTAPVSKEQLQAAGFPFPGQTEFFASQWGGEPSMAFSGKQLRVVLATWHEPLMGVGERLRSKPELLEQAISRCGLWMRTLGIDTPRIAVCGLNPHAGENGLLGREEAAFLDPQLDSLRRDWPGLSPCLPADTVFHRHVNGEFDAAVALYHDQGLIAVKTLEFTTAVNLTLGLPFVRTSPDHGTAFALAQAGGSVDTGSFSEAVALAWRMAHPLET
jgi:4-hydroxythreonine-4-phosphate dehydrogenase